MKNTHLGRTSKLQCPKLFMKSIYEIYPTMEFVPMTPQIPVVFFFFSLFLSHWTRNQNLETKPGVNTVHEQCPNSAQHNALLATMRSRSWQTILCHDRTTLLRALFLIVCAPKACRCAPDALSWVTERLYRVQQSASVARAVPYRDKLATRAMSVS